MKINKMVETNLNHYNQKELERALKNVGVKKGGLIFSHVGMGFLGYPSEGRSLEAMFKVIFQAFMNVLGPTGNLIVPTYTYSFCKGEVFDPKQSASTVGYFTEKFRKLSGVKRSLDPIFSVAGIGPKINELFNNLPNDCFGPDCIYDRLKKADASICNIGVGFQYATFIHYVEETVGVPYRFKKVFKGRLADESGERPREAIYYVRNAVDDSSTFPDLSRLEKEADLKGYLKKAAVGLGVVSRIGCRNLFDLSLSGIKENPWYLVKGYKK